MFSSLNFKFSKPDETIIPSKSLEKTISTENISNILYNYGLDVSQKYISYHDNYDSENEDEHNEWIDIDDYDTDKDSFDLQEAIDNACEALGGYDWEYFNGKIGIRIFFGNNK